MSGELESKHRVKLGYAPTRRNIFSKEEAGKFKTLIEEKIKTFGADIINLDWLNNEGLLYNSLDADVVAKRFTVEGVDALFSPHCNFGTEDAVARLAKKLNVPFLLWGPRDDAPLPDGCRSRDSQCGLFATSKVLQRYGVPFTYITNTTLEDEIFERGFKNFVAAASVVKTFRNLRIGQISTRPEEFLSVMCNEGELLERFGIEIVPIALNEIVKAVSRIEKEDKENIHETVEEIKKKVEYIGFEEEELARMAAFKLAIKYWANNNNLSAVAVQCWYAMQEALGIFPCFIDGELSDEGLPIVCETDIHGAITAAMVQAAGMGRTPTFFTDITIRHPVDNNTELLWHCGPFPYSLRKEGGKSSVSRHYLNPNPCPGVSEWEIKGGDISISRFDGMNGEYSLLMGHGYGAEGYMNRGTYVWVKFNDWPLWEEKLIYGPYNHHCVGIHSKIAPALYEACRYIPGLKPDPVEPTEAEIRKYLRA